MPYYGGDVRNWKYKPLDQIDANNFNQLQIACASRPTTWVRDPNFRWERRR